MFNERDVVWARRNDEVEFWGLRPRPDLAKLASAKRAMCSLPALQPNKILPCVRIDSFQLTAVQGQHVLSLPAQH